MGAIGALRTLTAAHRLGIMPCHVSQVGPMIEQGLIGCDVAFVQVSPPDADGNHSFGLISDFVQAAVAKARVVIAEVNEHVPFTHRRCGAAGRADRLRRARLAHAGRGHAGADRRDRSGDREDRGRLHRRRRGDSGRDRRGARCDPAPAPRPARSRRPFGHDRRWSGRSGRGGRGHQCAQADRRRRFHHGRADRHQASVRLRRTAIRRSACAAPLYARRGRAVAPAASW